MKITKGTGQKELILSAAYRCLTTKGYANSSLRDIADEAGVALSQLNYYFKSKDGLFIEVIRGRFQDYLRETRDTLSRHQLLPSKLPALVRYFQSTLTKQTDLFRLLYDFTSRALWTESFKNLISGMLHEFGNMIEGCIASDAQLGERLRPYSPRRFASLILSVLFGTAMQAALDPEDPSPADTLKAFELVLRSGEPAAL